MSTIALLTDFGLQDAYVGVIKGVLASIVPEARCIDITHSVAAHSVVQGAFLLDCAYRFFPKKAVFVGVVDPGVGSARRPIAIATKNYYFVGPDNGILSLAAARDGVREVIELRKRTYWLKAVSGTFHGRDIFAPVAARLAQGVPFSELGTKVKRMAQVQLPEVMVAHNEIRGHVLYTDHFGNLVTNITIQMLVDTFGNRRFNATLRRKHISRLCQSYEQGGKDPFFIEGSYGFLEISLKQGSAQKFFGLSPHGGDCIKIIKK